MSLSSDFFSHAIELSKGGETADSIVLRRIVSAAYYALFHLLIEDATELLGPNLSPEIRHRIQRWFEHGTMKQICGRFGKSNLDQPLKDLVGDTASFDLQKVCNTFITLQEARHKADYDSSHIVDFKEALQQLALSVTARQAWKRIRQTSEANVFLLSFLLFKNWERDRL